MGSKSDHFLNLLSAALGTVEGQERSSLSTHLFSQKLSSYSQSVAKIKANHRKFQRQLINCKTNRERVALLLDDQEIMVAINELVSMLISSRDKRLNGKSLAKASKSREDGNQFFKRQLMKKALVEYNEAILQAPDDSDSIELSLCFANRSAALFYINRFEDSLLDIEVSLSKNYPKEKTPVLLTRKLKCLISLGKDGEIEQEANTFADNNINVSEVRDKYLQQIQSKSDLNGHQPSRDIRFNLKEPNERLVGANSSVKMGFDPEKGRTIIATRDIEEGEVILVEKPIVSSLDPTYYSEHCHHCLKPLNGRLIPCSDCSLVRFCSNQCRDESWGQYHSIECPYLDTLKEMASNVIPLRMVLLFGIQRALDVENEPQLPDNQWPESKFKHDLKSLTSLYFRSDLEFGHLFARTFTAALLTQFSIVISLAKDVQREALGGLFLKMILQLEANCFAIYDKQLTKSKYDGVLTSISDDISIGTGLYGTGSLLSHRCFTNTYRWFLGSEMILTSTRSIKSGEEVTVDYLGRARDKTFSDRRQALEKVRGFICRCIDCKAAKEKPRFRCLNCRGNLVKNSDGTNRCEKCKRRNQNIDCILSRGCEFEENFEEANESLEKKRWDQALSRLLYCQKIYATDLQKDHFNHLFVKEPLSRCYEEKKMFKEAIKYRLETVYYEKLQSGDHSFHVLNHLVKVVELCLEKGRGEEEQDKTSSEAKRRFEECSVIFNRIMRMELKAPTKEQLELIPRMERLTQLLFPEP